MADPATRQEQAKPAAQDPQIPVPPPTEAQAEVEKVKQFVKDYGQSAVIGLGLALALILGFGAYKNYKASQSVRANQLLMSARSPEQLQQIVNQYASTPVAPVAMLTLASQYYDSGQYDLARFTYAQFAQKYPDHPLRAAAEVGQAQALEGSGQLDQAVAAFAAFEKTQPNSFLYPVATLGRARCLTQLGRFEEAKAVYEDFIAANPKSGWLSLAETALLFVDKDLRAKEKGLDVQEPVSFPAAQPVAPSSLFPESPAAVEPPPAAAEPAR